LMRSTSPPHPLSIAMERGWGDEVDHCAALGAV
jgi:hypothetical protein